MPTMMGTEWDSWSARSLFKWVEALYLPSHTVKTRVLSWPLQWRSGYRDNRRLTKDTWPRASYPTSVALFLVTSISFHPLSTDILKVSLSNGRVQTLMRWSNSTFHRTSCLCHNKSQFSSEALTCKTQTIAERTRTKRSLASNWKFKSIRYLSQPIAQSLWLNVGTTSVSKTAGILSNLVGPTETGTLQGRKTTIKLCFSRLRNLRYSSHSSKKKKLKAWSAAATLVFSTASSKTTKACSSCPILA